MDILEPLKSASFFRKCPIVGSGKTVGKAPLFRSMPCMRPFECHASQLNGGLGDIRIFIWSALWERFEDLCGIFWQDTAAENLLHIQKEIKQDPNGKPPAVLCALWYGKCGLSASGWSVCGAYYCIKKLIFLNRMLQSVHHTGSFCAIMLLVICLP